MSSRRALYGWLTAEALSLTGTRVSMIAIPWLVLTTTGSATLTGLVAFAEMTPMVLLKVLGGPVIDRLGARRVAVTCDLLSVVVVGLVPVLHLLDMLAFPLLLLLVAFAGALRGPGDAAKYSLVPRIAAHTGVSNERVTGLNSSVERGASMLGSAFAGGLVVAVGPANALVIDALSFLLSAAVLGWATVSMGRPEPSGEAQTSYRTQLREGWTFLSREPVLLGLSVMIALTNLLDLAWVSVLLPVWAKESGGGAAVIGAVLAVWAAFSVAGSLVAAAWGEQMPRFRTYVVAFLVTGAPRFVVFALGAPWWVIFAVCAVGGFGSGFLNPILGAVFFERIPAPLVGRVSSMSTAMCFALMPLGGLLGAALVVGFGVDSGLLVLAAAYFVVTMGPAAVIPSYRRMDRVEASVPPRVEARRL